MAMSDWCGVVLVGDSFMTIWVIVVDHQESISPLGEGVVPREGHRNPLKEGEAK